ncbi:sigma-54 interaction domain-containing protein [Cupriavidus pauculus]|uniref:sigma-54 interaction domain-containing protein n=1 Tax=Cupriavidus pauculus TaxID=82633 RepID=UPI001246A5C0|nr:sigma 54-interacting transcriptional regulator [Cupriavidus pauculus]KAB0599940.1 PAS domain-containing protein [Cupriavidus pauculus]MCM3604691.1 sigma 54-interacting transcriptional regulator [Cupriavidus pauculus]UAK98732.1 sigma 54-interacting transcriptional regulator [Cupriavidus pauculus]
MQKIAEPGGALLLDYDDVARRAMETLFRTFENFSEGTFVVDEHARVVWINKRYAARFGFTDPQAAIGLDCEQVIPNSLMREVVTTGKPILLDLLETDREPMIVTRLPIKDDAGRTIGAVGFALFDELKALTPIFAHYSRVQAELAAARKSLDQVRRAKYTFASFVGTTPAAQEVKRQARRAALVESPVLLLGETGTGKELLAHGIHAGSARAEQALVTVNVAAIPDTLLEVEFFGAAPGAYTGVDRKGRVGKFELADGGTLFLDEIGEMPLALQSKLLRALQDREFEPLGSNRIVRSDVRIIAATSADLPALVAAGRFRADLYYRLNVLTIELPPLRERRDDLLPMVYAIIEELSIKAERHPLGLRDDALKLLRDYDWPGNVRELRNVLERVVMLCDEDSVDAAALAPLLGVRRGAAPGHAPAPPPAVSEVAADVDGADSAHAGAVAPAVLAQASAMPAAATWPATQNYAEAMARFETAFLTQALEACGGRVAEAAARVGISRAAFYRKLAAAR